MTIAPDSATPKPPKKPLSDQIRLPAFMPFFWLGLAAMAGPFMAQSFKPQISLCLIALGLSILLSVIDIIKNTRQKNPRKLSLFLVIATLCLSATLYLLTLPKGTPQDIGYYNGKGTVNLSGLVIKPPRQKQNVIELTVKVASIKQLQSDNSAQKLRGLLLVEVPLGSVYHYGDRISVYGELNQVPEGSSFSYREYLFHKNTHSISQYGAVKTLSSGHGCFLLRALYALRERSSQVLQNNFPNPESALLRGILLGDESGISSQLAEAYSRTGTSHIIAISGFNMAVLAAVVSAILRRHMGRQRGGLIAIGVLALYTLFVGGAPAVTRAFLMSAIAIFGSSIARRGNLLNSLGLSIFIMVLINPHLPWDIGFQFSVMATLALSLFARPVQAWVEEKLQVRVSEERARKLAGFISEYFLITLIAQVLVLPLIIYHFQQVSWLFLLANPLILPLQPIVMVLGLLALIGGLFSVRLGQFLSWLCWPFVAYTNRMVTWLASLAPTAWQLPRFNALWLVLYYTLVYLLAFKPKLKKIEGTLWKSLFTLLGLGSLCVVLAVHLSSQPDGNLKLRVFGKTDQVILLARTPNGEFIFTGGAKDSASLTELVSKSLPAFKQELSFIVIPACKKADVNGFYGIANQIKIGQVLWTCDPESTRASQNMYSYFENLSLPQVFLNDNYLLNWEEGEMHFKIEEDHLKQLSIKYNGFIAQFDYSPQTATPSSDDITLWVGDANQHYPCARVMLNSNERVITESHSCSAEWLQLSKHDWVEVSTDGTQIWLRAK